jgi:hypothetical protein
MQAAKVFVCYQHQLPTLQQLTILYAPDESDETFDDADGRENLYVTLLMTHELLRPVANSEEEVIATMILDQIRMTLSGT